MAAVIDVAHQEDENCDGHRNGHAHDGHCKHRLIVSDDDVVDDEKEHDDGR